MSYSRSRRRSFLTQLGAGMTVAGAAFAAGDAPAAAQAAGTPFRPARHPEDAWIDALPGSHRLVIDTTTPNGFAEALAFAGNFLTASASYKLTDHDNAVIIVARHFSTPFAYKDPIWAKYAKVMPPVATMKDPKTGQVPAFNLFNATGYGMDLPNFGTTVDAVVGRGVHFAVCQMATQFFAGLIAGPNGNKQAVYDELAGALVGNSHLVAAGVIGVNRAQEYGYTLITAG
jgi:hypothetical protein